MAGRIAAGRGLAITYKMQVQQPTKTFCNFMQKRLAKNRSIYRCKHSSDKELKRYIRCVGELTEEEVEKFLSLYKKSIEDLVQLFSADQRMKEYLGL